MVTSSIWLGWCNSGKIFTCNELKGTTALPLVRHLIRNSAPTNGSGIRRRCLVWLKWLIFIAFPAQFMGSLRKHFAHHPQYGSPTPTCFWNPGNLDASRYVHVSWRTCLHSTHPRFRAFIIQWNSPCWLQGSWFTVKLSNAQEQRRQSLWSCGGKRASQQLQAAGE